MKIKKKILLFEEDIQQWWMRYFAKLFNKVFENTIDFSDLNILNEYKFFYFYQCISKTEVRDVLKKIKCGKAVGSDNISIEVWKFLGDEGIFWLTKVFNIILKIKKISDEWRMSVLISIFMNKGNAPDCVNYR